MQGLTGNYKQVLQVVERPELVQVDEAEAETVDEGRLVARKFLEELFDPQRSQPYVRKREALLEWVRRGGKLLVSVGRDANKLKQYPAFTDLLPVALDGQGHKEVTALEFPYTRGVGTTTTAVELTHRVIHPMTAG